MTGIVWKLYKVSIDFHKTTDKIGLIKSPVKSVGKKETTDDETSDTILLFLKCTRKNATELSQVKEIDYLQELQECQTLFMWCAPVPRRRKKKTGIMIDKLKQRVA